VFEGGRKFGWAGPVVALVAACTPPTAVRRTTLIPTPSLPARVGAPLAGGEGRGGLELNAGHLTPDLVFEDGEFGDPGVLIPDAHLGGSFYFGLHDLIEVGGHLQYAHARWSSPNVLNVLPFPKGTRDDFWKGGLGARLNLRLGGDRKLRPALSLLAELEAVGLPEVVFVRQDDGRYGLKEERNFFFFVPNGAAHLGLSIELGTSPRQVLHAGGLVGLTTSVKNVGFDELENVDDDTTESFLVSYGGVGVDYRVEFIFIGGHVYLPFDDQEMVRFGPRLQLQAGYAF